MPLQLRENIHWCDSGGRAIFLDVEADRYFCLSAAASNAFLRLAAGESEPSDTQPLQMLVTKGVLVESDKFSAVPQPPEIEPPARNLVDEPYRGVHLLTVARALALELFMERQLRTKPFHEVLEAAKPAPCGSRSDREQEQLLQTIASASAAVSYLRRLEGRCLVRALAVNAICKSKGITSKLVFGVIAHPFAAHCWVQLGDAVLVGGFEHTRLYTPILVVQ